MSGNVSGNESDSVAGNVATNRRKYSWGVYTDSARPVALAAARKGPAGEGDLDDLVEAGSLPEAAVKFIDMVAGFGDIARLEVVAEPDRAAGGRNLKAWVDVA